jgi:hypothetical protein
LANFSPTALLENLLSDQPLSVKNMVLSIINAVSGGSPKQIGRVLVDVFKASGSALSVFGESFASWVGEIWVSIKSAIVEDAIGSVGSVATKITGAASSAWNFVSGIVNPNVTESPTVAKEITALHNDINVLEASVVASIEQASSWSVSSAVCGGITWVLKGQISAFVASFKVVAGVAGCDNVYDYINVFNIFMWYLSLITKLLIGGGSLREYLQKGGSALAKAKGAIFVEVDDTELFDDRCMPNAAFFTKINKELQQIEIEGLRVRRLVDTASMSNSEILGIEPLKPQTAIERIAAEIAESETGITAAGKEARESQLRQIKRRR